MTDTTQSLPPITALVLAGQRAGGDTVANAEQVACKAFADIDGTPMAERVIITLQNTAGIDDILICLDDHIETPAQSPQLHRWIENGAVKRIDPEGRPSTSVLKTLDALPPDRIMLVTTGDHPLLTDDMLSRTITAFMASDADACAAVVSADAVERAYPQTKRTRLTFKDGNYKGCNIFLLRGHKARGVPLFWQTLDADRKKPWKLALRLGPVAILQYLCGQLTLDKAIDKIGRKTGTKLMTAELDDPHAGIDVDKPEDLRLVRSIFQEKLRQKAG